MDTSFWKWDAAATCLVKSSVHLPPPLAQFHPPNSLSSVQFHSPGKSSLQRAGRGCRGEAKVKASRKMTASSQCEATHSQRNTVGRSLWGRPKPALCPSLPPCRACWEEGLESKPLFFGDRYHFGELLQACQFDRALVDLTDLACREGKVQR